MWAATYLAISSSSMTSAVLCPRCSFGERGRQSDVGGRDSAFCFGVRVRERNGEGEGRSGAGLAVDVEFAAEQRSQSSRDWKSKSRALRGCLQRPFDLLEFVEDPRAVLAIDADARVGDGEDDPSCIRLDTRMDAYLAFFGELERVGDEVSQDLRDLRFVAADRAQIIRGFDHERDAVVVDVVGGTSPGGPRTDRRSRTAGVDCCLSCFDSCEVKQIVYQRQQALGTSADVLDLPFLLFAQRPVCTRKQEVTERERRAERGSELVADA